MSEAIVELSVRLYTILLPVSWIVLAIAVFVLVPMALSQNTRSQAGTGLMMASWLFGLTTWTLGAAVTFATYGILGFLIGVMFFGIGVVPIGIFAALVTLKSASLGLSLVVMAVVVWVSRVAGIALMDSGSTY